MPELPEVETTVKYLREVWLSKAIKDVSLFNNGESQLNVDAEVFRERLIGSTLTNLERYGKWMIFRFNNNEIEAVGHLRMSGRYLAEESQVDHPHKRIEFILDDGNHLAYIDQRRFGTWELVDNSQDFLATKKLGPDALSEEFSKEYLVNRLSKSNRFIYTDLLDQSVIAGLGNIYVNESLHLTGIHPMSKSFKVPKDLLFTLVDNIKSILLTSLSLKGTTLSDNLYSTPEGKTGTFASMLKVYGKKKAGISLEKIGGRTAYVDTLQQILFD